MVNREKLAKIIIELRKKKGYSQRKLAMISGVSNSTISRIESATSDADPETLKKLAPYLEIPYETLMQAAGYIDIDSLSTNTISNIETTTTFSDRLKKLRTEKGILQKELAEYLNVSRVTITQYENGSRSPDDETKKKIAKYFNVSLDYLMGASDIRNPYNENKEISEVDKFLLKLKEEMQKQGLDFDETSPEELIETYKLLMEFKKKTQNNKDK